MSYELRVGTVLTNRMPIMDGRTAAKEIRKLEKRTPQPQGINPLRIDDRIPIFAVSASLYESDRTNMAEHFDGWILKPLGEYNDIFPSIIADTRFQPSSSNLDRTGRSSQAVQRGLRSRPVGERRLPPR